MGNVYLVHPLFTNKLLNSNFSYLRDFEQATSSGSQDFSRVSSVEGVFDTDDPDPSKSSSSVTIMLLEWCCKVVWGVKNRKLDDVQSKKKFKKQKWLTDDASASSLAIAVTFVDLAVDVAVDGVVAEGGELDSGLADSIFDGFSVVVVLESVFKKLSNQPNWRMTLRPAATNPPSWSSSTEAGVSCAWLPLSADAATLLDEGACRYSLLCLSLESISTGCSLLSANTRSLSVCKHKQNVR